MNRNIKAVVHKAEEGGYWAEVPALSGCATQGETVEEVAANLCEAIEGCLCADIAPSYLVGDSKVLEVASISAVAM